MSNWKSEGSQATQARRARLEKLPLLLEVPGAQVSLDRTLEDRAWRSANIRVTYPGRHLGDLRGVLASFVLLEVGSARVTPFVAREMTRRRASAGAAWYYNENINISFIKVLDDQARISIVAEYN